MRAFAAFVVVAASLVVDAGGARAAATSCTADAQCAANQKCRNSDSICVFEAIDADTFVAAVTAANADAAADVINVGPVNAAPPPEDPLVVAFDTSAVDDNAFGPTALPVITTPITVDGVNADTVTLDDNDDLRIFLVRAVATSVNVASLTLKNIAIIDARPGQNNAGNVVGGGAVHVANVANSAGILATLTATNVTFASSGDDGTVAAAVVSLQGGDTTLTNCRFLNNTGATAGAVLALTGALKIVGGTFDGNSADGGAGAISTAVDTTINGGALFHGNSGAVGAIDAITATEDDGTGTNTLVDVNVHITGVTFDSNNGTSAGALRSVAKTLLDNDTFKSNRADGDGAFGGAVFSRNLTIENGTYRNNFASAGGGAVAILDEPASEPISISGADFSANSTSDVGGAVFATGAPITITDTIFDSNTSVNGGALYLKNLAERNGAAPDASITNNVFGSSFASVSVTIVQGDVSVDEKGTDTGFIVISVLGTGSALVVDGTGSVTASGNCFSGNSAPAAQARNGGAVNATGNWWGDAAGPTGPNGDLVDSTVNAVSPLSAPTAKCAGTPVNAPLQIFVPATVTTDSAQIGVDYTMKDDASGITILNAANGQFSPNLRTGQVHVDVVGVNDTETEGDETFTFTITPCAGTCQYETVGQNTIAMTITDDGDGGEGEGEGEGGCDEQIIVNPTSLVLADTGKESTAALTVTNAGSCDVQLLAPFLQKGVSQGFGVKPIAQKNLALAQGKSLAVTVTFTPPDPSSDGTDSSSTAPPTGQLLIESAGGTLKPVALSLAGGCSCDSAHRRSAPTGALALAALALLMARCGRGSARRG